MEEQEEGGRRAEGHCCLHASSVTSSRLPFCPPLAALKQTTYIVSAHGDTANVFFLMQISFTKHLKCCLSRYSTNFDKEVWHEV